MKNPVEDKDFSFSPVPQSQRKGFIIQFFVILAFTFFSSSMVAGGQLGLGLELKTFFLVVLAGNLILGTYAGVLAYISAGSGLSTHLLTQYSFGKYGSYLTSFLLGAIQVGWFGVGVATFALLVNQVTNINMYILILIGGVLMSSTAYWGFKALTILSFIAVPAIAILGSVSVFQATESAGGLSAMMHLNPENPIVFTTALTMCIGSFIGGATLTPDFMRFTKTKKAALFATLLGFFIGNSLMFVFGAMGAMSTGYSDISEVMITQGLIIPAILILGLNIWSTNDNSLYASGLAFAHITKKPKNKIVILNGLLGTVLSLWLFSNFVSWLVLLGSVLPPIGAIIIADYIMHHRKGYPQVNEIQNVRWVSVISWIAGILAGQFIPGITPLNAIIGAMIFYFVANKVFQTEDAKQTETEMELQPNK